MKGSIGSRWKNAVLRRIAPWVARLSEPCADIVRLVSASCDRPLTWRERWRLRAHYAVCAWCRRYAAQVRWVHDAAPGWIRGGISARGRSMPPEVRERIKRRLLTGD